MSASASITTTDGTIFSVGSELVRGEPRWYWIYRRLPGEREARRVWKGSPEGSYTKSVAVSRMRKAARLHEERHSKPTAFTENRTLKFDLAEQWLIIEALDLMIGTDTKPTCAVVSLRQRIAHEETT